MLELSLPQMNSAEVHVLSDGYGLNESIPWTVASTVTYIRDGDAHVIVDPGMVADRRSLIDGLRSLGVDPEQITDVVLSHHHPDHTLNAGLFPEARVHDHWAIYRDDSWTPRPAHGFEVSPSIRLAETPGHSPQDITTLVGTQSGLVALTHLWFMSVGPADDPFCSDGDSLHIHRSRVLEVADQIVPGHGPAFKPDASTPR
jgi:glyoxylase-like metal-dependent hydrolase (beta-lactamase superfamily II)